MSDTDIYRVLYEVNGVWYPRTTRSSRDGLYISLDTARRAIIGGKTLDNRWLDNPYQYKIQKLESSYIWSNQEELCILKWVEFDA